LGDSRTEAGWRLTHRVGTNEAGRFLPIVPRRLPTDTRSFAPGGRRWSLAESIEERFGIAVARSAAAVLASRRRGRLRRRRDLRLRRRRLRIVRPEVLEWNAAPWWRSVYPMPRGRFRSSSGRLPSATSWDSDGRAAWALPELFMADTMEVFPARSGPRELLGELLVARGALCDSERLARAAKQCGPLPPGQHYAPDVSPLARGHRRVVPPSSRPRLT